MKKLILILSLLLSAFFVNAQFGSRIDFTKSTLTPLAAGAFDFDGDGDLDVLSGSGGDDKITWHENLGGGNFGVQQIISLNADGPQSVFASDIDNDGDLDVLSASSNDNKIAWYENLGSGTIDTTQQIISTNAMGARSVYSADLDNDGDFDVLSASISDNKIAWYENLGGGTFGSEQIIETVSGAVSVFASDIDNDGNIDVIYAGSGVNRVAWNQNLGGGTFGFYKLISTNADNVKSIHTADIDGDGKIDVLSASYDDDKIAWYKNLGGAVFGSEQIISSSADGALSVCSFDYDSDGDMDVFSASQLDDKIAWYENLGSGIFGSEQIITSTADQARSVFPADLDSDGNIDVLSVSLVVDWHKNIGGGSFGIQKDISSSVNDPASLHTDDLDNDGDIDLLSAYDNKIVWHENLGNSNFGIQHVITSSAMGSSCVYSADIDGDGDLDVLSASLYDDKIAWYENIGNGIFGTDQVLNVSNYPLSQAFFIYGSDFDNDGDVDILSAHHGNNTLNNKILWYENLGGGVFGGEQLLANISNQYSPILFDVENDGDIDIFLISNSGGTGGIIWIENLGGGAFSPQQNATSVPFMGNIMEGDIDNDGDQDILFAHSSPFSGDRIGWYENLGGGTFSSEHVLSTNIDLPIAVFSDVDGDNDLDIIWTGHYVGSSSNEKIIAWYENLGNGVFGPEQRIEFNEGWPDILITADIDMDGDDDLISGASYGYDLGLFKNFFNYNYKLKGQLFYDANQNAIRDSNEKGLPFIQTQVQPSALVSYTANNGDYFFAADTGTYIVSYGSFPQWSLTTDSVNYTKTLTVQNSIVDSLNFGFYPDTIVNDINAEIIGSFPRCNTVVNYWLDVKNNGTTIPSGIIQLQLDDSISYVGSAIAPDSINGQNIYWHYDSLFFFSSKQINLQVLMPDFNSIDDSLTSYLNISVIDSLENQVFLASDTLNPILVCAYDPNDKIADPVGIDSLGYISANTEYIEYTVRFQNTGNDTAITVNILDQLDTNLIWNTLTPLASSHPIQIDVDQNGEVSFKFENILLPDSGADFLGSQGFVKYKIDLKTGLTTGTNILNTAHIYFDQNPAVITNTKINTIYDCNGFVQNTISNLSVCKNDTISGSVSDDLSTTIFNWDIPNVYNSVAANFSWLADTAGTFYLSLSATNSVCNKDTTIVLNVTPIFISNQTISICNGDSLLLYGTYQNTAGIYYDSLQTINGCDSILSTTLTTNPLPNVTLASFSPDTLCVTASSATLPAGSPTGGNYSGNGVIGGSFNPSTAGIGTHDIIYSYTDGNSCINSDTTIVTVDICTGIDNRSTDFGIIIYPNPSTGQFTIEKPNDFNKAVQIKLLDATSKLILEKIMPIDNQKVEIDIRNYSKGIYYLQLIVEDEIFVKQILKN